MNPATATPAGPLGGCGPSAGEARGWVGAHLYFHGDLDEVVIGVVDPAVRDAPDGRWFFLRYWEGGPHVRLRVSAPSPDGRDRLRAALREHAGDWFARNPSPDRMTEEQYRDVRRWAVGIEPWTSPATALSPNNSIRFEPYRPEYDRYGSGRTLAAVERHFAESSEIALAVVGERTPAAQRELLALCALVTSWSLARPDAGRLAAWIAAGGTRYGRAVTGGDEVAHAWAGGHADTVRAVVRHTLEAARPDGAGPGPDTLRGRWTRSVRTLCSALDGAAGAPGGRPADGEPVSRVVDHCAHLYCNRIGLGLGREAALRTLAARSVLDVLEDR